MRKEWKIITKFRIECDETGTKIWIGDNEISGMVEKVEFLQTGDRIPRVELAFYPFNSAVFACARKDGADG